MDYVGWIIGIFGIVLSFLLSYTFYRRSEGIKDIKNVRKKVVDLLIYEIANNEQPLQTAVVEALLNTKYRGTRVVFVSDTELPLIIDDVVTQIIENVFIPKERRQVLLDRALDLKNRFQKRTSDLDETFIDWKRSSPVRIAFGVFSTVWLGLTVGFLAIVAGIIVNQRYFNATIDLVSLYVEFGLVFLIALVFGIRQFNKMKNERTSSTKYLYKALEDSVRDGIRNSLGSVMFERNVIVESDGHSSRADLVVVSNGKKIPVEIKCGGVKSETINGIAGLMEQMGSPKGIIVTLSRVSGKVKELANKQRVIVVEAVTSEEDIVNALRDTKLVE